MKNNTPFDPVELSGAVLTVYFIITAIVVMMMERLGIDAGTATRIAPVMMPMMITIIMIGRIADQVLRTGITLIGRVLRMPRAASAEDKR